MISEQIEKQRLIGSIVVCFLCFDTSLYRHYKQAYILLAELRATDPNLLEVKTIAGIINYKARTFLSLSSVSAIVIWRAYFLLSSFLSDRNTRLNVSTFKIYTSSMD